MAIIIAAVSIIAMAALARLAGKFLPFRPCPICAGVAGTWLWMLIGIFLGLLPASDFRLAAAVLMGGSVVGIAYQAEKKLPTKRSPFFWKTFFIPIGFVAVYGAVAKEWIMFAVSLVILLSIALVFFRRKKNEIENRDNKIKELEEKMKNCC